MSFSSSNNSIITPFSKLFGHLTIKLVYENDQQQVQYAACYIGKKAGEWPLNKKKQKKKNRYSKKKYRRWLVFTSSLRIKT
jgi:hypothetical protein